MKSKVTPLMGAALLLLGGAAQAQEDRVEYVITDAWGNIRAIEDEQGNVIERHDYLPFGEECLTGPCAANPGLGSGQPLRFTGKERDQETGLDYFGARYYAPAVGRFTTVDPNLNTAAALVDPQRWNRYAYGRSNPLRYVDPDGRDIFTYFGGLFTAFGSNLTGGMVARPTSSDSDFRFGQTVGDTLSLAAAGYEAYVGGGLIAGGSGATLTVAGGAVGVPAAVGGGLLAGHAVAFGGSALISLSNNSREGMGFTKAGKRQIDQANAEKYGGQNVCENCGATVQPGKKHEKGVTPPGAERQRDHVTPRSKGGRGTPDNGQVLCRDCNIDKSDKQP